MTPPVELTADADPAAGFENQVAPLLGDLHRQALRMTRHHADAEDLVQDTLAKAFAGFDSFRPDSNICAGCTQSWPTPTSVIAVKPSGGQYSI